MACISRANLVFVIVIELLGALLLTGLAGWLVVHDFDGRRPLPIRSKTCILCLAGALGTITFFTAFLVLRVCAQRLLPDDPLASERTAQRSPSPPAATAVDKRWAPALQFIEGTNSVGDSAQATAREDQRADRYGGYRAGFALATDPKHRGSKVSTDTVLNAIVSIRCKGRTAEFADGFRRGYLAGLAGEGLFPRPPKFAAFDP